MKHIVLTGGGTAGHVTPNMALVPKLIDEGYNIYYIGSYEGMEKKLIEDIGVTYYGISSGKLRRYFSLQNFTDPFRVIKGFGEARKLIKGLKPDVIFSKGGFVSVPVVLAGKRCKVPVIIHESDMTPGLANKLAIPSAVKVCCNFPETKDMFPEGKAVVTGTPIRKELFNGNAVDAINFCGFTDNKPGILIVGGSSGSAVINRAIRENIDKLLKRFNVIHLCGKDNLDHSLDNKPGYAQYEYIKKELSSMLALADLVISRAGANAICELLALRKPNILIPLSAAASRGDQILNAESFKKSGYSYVIKEEELSSETLFAAIDDVYNNKQTYIETMEKSNLTDSTSIIVGMIEELVNNK